MKSISADQEVLPVNEPLMLSTDVYPEKHVTSPSPTEFQPEEREDSQEQQQPRRQPSGWDEALTYKLTQASSWACIVVCGQLIILAISLTFFILIHFSRTPMPQNLAEWGNRSPRALSFCVTILATLLSSLTTFFFSKSLILYLTSHSNRPAPLINFMMISSLSRGAPLVSRHYCSWTLLSLLALVLINSLTASFTTIISPTPLIISMPFRGTELNLYSEGFADIMTNTTRANLFPVLTSSQKRMNDQVAAATTALSLSSSYISASRHLGYPGAISYLGISFNSSTGGVLPAIPRKQGAIDANPSIAFSPNFRNLQPTFEFLDPNFQPSKKFPFNFTTIQQGYTADVKCRELPVNATDRDAGISVHEDRNFTIPGYSRNTSLWTYHVRCPSQGAPLPRTNHTVVLAWKGSMIVSDTCYNTTFDGRHVPGTQLLILGGYGPMYQHIRPRACQFTPYITLSEVTYVNMVNISRVLSREATTLATAAIAATVYQSVVFSINSYAVDVRNKFGDDISSLYGISTEIDNYNAPLLDGILEAYLQGEIETRATLIKTPPIVVGRPAVHLRATTLEELPSEWKRSFDGVWSYETLGWHEDNNNMQVSIVGIIPIIVLSTTTIFLVLYSWFSLRGSRHLRDEPFDPNNLVTLLKAGRDGAVVDSLGNDKTVSSTSARSNVKIKLHRNATEWELRPV
ncbi:hypothetical protein PCANC_26884 [Puccinia coronata f. sp. avenae]|uniref:Uncharacterized protein n=1 Tax=Puccinia coronata f. sp. avenae TaxID=200324 RepID=A0A2N5RXC8_9BASI|nr:hypothetical protein PCANC_26884 [Puccinia coronata f. sp. avenae]